MASVVWMHVGTTRGARAPRSECIKYHRRCVCSDCLAGQLLLRAGRVLGCWRRSFSRPRAEARWRRVVRGRTPGGRVTFPAALVRRARVSCTGSGNASVAPARRHGMGRVARTAWVGRRPPPHQLAGTTKPAPLWAGDASGERRPLGSNWAARGSAAPRGAVSVPAFRRPARPDACRVI